MSQPVDYLLSLIEHLETNVAEEPASSQVEESHSAEEHFPLESVFESLDYEIIENDLYKEEERSPRYHLNLYWRGFNRWVVCFIIGVLTALTACFIDISVHSMARWKFDTLRNLLLSCPLNPSKCLVIPVFAWIGFNCFFVAFAVSLVVFFAGPVASGSGIPQIKCFLNGIRIPGVVRVKTLIAKAVGVAFSVAGGLSVGKEGPMIHSGAVIAAGVSQGRCISLPFDFKIFEYFRTDREKRDFVSVGAAAGVAAAFGAPIGGVLFSLEEGASFWNQELTWRMFFSSMVSCFTLSLVLSAYYGKAGDLSWAGLVNFGTFDILDYKVWEIFFFILIGVIGGLSGALFNSINLKLSLFRKKYVVFGWSRLFEVLLVASASAVGASLMIFAMDDCKAMGVNPNITNPIQLWCPDAHYSAVAGLFFGTPEETVKTLFHSPPGAYNWETLTLFALLYFILSTWTYGLMVPSGLFIPALLTGAAWGRLVGMGVGAIFPFEYIDPGKYALAGAAAQLGGVVRMTISLCAILVEATRDLAFGLPIMLVLMTAKWVGDCFNEGLYDIHIELAGVPFLKFDPPNCSTHIQAKDVMSKSLVTLRPTESVQRLWSLIKVYKHHAYPVVSTDAADEGRLMGLILRSQIITILQFRHFTMDGHMVAGSRPLKPQDFRNAYPRHDQVLECLTISRTDEQCEVDLRQFLHCTPRRVQLSASLPSMYSLFRGLGLRGVVVVDEHNVPQGLVTRKDLARYKEVRKGSKWTVVEVPFVHPS